LRARTDCGRNTPAASLILMETFSPEPPFNGLLGLLPYGAPPQDPDCVRMAAGVAVETGAVRDDGGKAVRALAAACAHAADISVRYREGAAGPGDLREAGYDVAAGEGRPVCAIVTFSAADLRMHALNAVLSGYDASPFPGCVGPLPEEVAARIKCLRARPALAPLLSLTAAEHLADAVLGMAARLPGARTMPNGDVLWACASPSRAEMGDALEWLELPGIGGLASGVVVVGGKALVSDE